MRNLDSLDYSKKHFVSPEFNFNIIRAGRKINLLKNRGIDYTKYENIKQYNVSFNDYVEALANLDKLDVYFKKEQAKWKYFKSLDPVCSSIYKIPNIYRIILRINNSDNKEQLFYDELSLPFFRNYIELILSNEVINIKLHQRGIRKSNKEIYFKTPYEFIEIIKSPLLTKKQKLKMINDTYNSCQTIKYSSLMIENLIKKENLINIELDDQRYLINKWYELNTYKQIKKLSKLGVDYGRI